MKKHYEENNSWEDLRNKVIGLGEDSIRKNYYAELQNRLDELEQFKFIVDNAKEEFYLLRPEGQLVYVNEAAVKSLGYSFAELTGFRISEIDPNYSQEIFEQTFQWLKEGDVPPFETVHRTKGGNLIPKEMQAVYLKLGEKEYICAFGRDITKRKQFETEIIKAKEKAEKSDRLKSEFIAQMSHEIRTPVNTILSFISLVKTELQENFSSDLKISFKALDNGAKRLIKTIDSLLNMSQIQSGNYEIRPERIDLIKDILDNLLFDFHTQAKQKGLCFFLINESADSSVYADLYSVSQLFFNLIDNALKYTQHGKVVIRVYNENKNEDENISEGGNKNKGEHKHLCVDITDTGVGISEEYLPELFEPFSQEDTGYRRRFDGNGLGLALVLKYAELNNAVVCVRSKKDEGTTFTVRFKD